MTKRILPTPEQLRELLHYEPDTGKLFWRERGISYFPDERAWKSWNTRLSGKETFKSCTQHGHKKASIFNATWLGHRVAWAIHYGEWAENEVDHINGDPTDNRISNLRLATRAENGRNRKISKANTSGYKGVWWDNARSRWRAAIRIDGVKTALGCFPDPETAHAAYCEAASKYHGEFARFE